MGRSVLDALRRREQARKGDPESTRAVTAAKAAALAVTATAIATGAYVAWNSVTPAPPVSQSTTDPVDVPTEFNAQAEQLKDVMRSDDDKRTLLTTIGAYEARTHMKRSPGLITLLTTSNIDLILGALLRTPTLCAELDENVRAVVAAELLTRVANGEPGTGNLLGRLGRVTHDKIAVPDGPEPNDEYLHALAARGGDIDLLDVLKYVHGLDTQIGGDEQIFPDEYDPEFYASFMAAGRAAASAYTDTDAALTIASAGLGHCPYEMHALATCNVTLADYVRLRIGGMLLAACEDGTATYTWFLFWHLMLGDEALHPKALAHLRGLKVACENQKPFLACLKAKYGVPDAESDTVLAEYAKVADFRYVFRLWRHFPEFSERIPDDDIPNFIMENVRHLREIDDKVNIDPAIVLAKLREMYADKVDDDDLADGVCSLYAGPKSLSDFAGALKAGVLEMAAGNTKMSDAFLRILACVLKANDELSVNVDVLCKTTIGKDNESDFATVLSRCTGPGTGADAGYQALECAEKGYTGVACRMLTLVRLPEFLVRSDHLVLLACNHSLDAKRCKELCTIETLTQLARTWYRNALGRNDRHQINALSTLLPHADSEMKAKLRQVLDTLVAQCEARGVEWQSEIKTIREKLAHAPSAFGMLYTD